MSSERKSEEALIKSSLPQNAPQDRRNSQRKSTSCLRISRGKRLNQRFPKRNPVTEPGSANGPAITWKLDCEGVDFARVAALLREAGLSELDAAAQEKVFRRSWAVAFPMDGEHVVGCGRALSDGICQAAIYNIAIDEQYRGRELGRQIIEKLLEQVRGCTTVLYTHPQTVKFYERLGGWHRQKTGFVHYNGAADEEHLRWYAETGFILPEGFRYERDESEDYPVPGKDA